MYYKINNLIQSTGSADYKGLDTSLFVPGKQLYDFEANTCAIETTEEFEHEDVEVLDEASYLYYKHVLDEKKEFDPYAEVQILKAENAMLKEQSQIHEEALFEFFIYVTTLLEPQEGGE